MKKVYLLISILLCFSWESRTQILCTTEESTTQYDGGSQCTMNSYVWNEFFKKKESYEPWQDGHPFTQTPVKIIEINLNIFQRTLGTGNFQNTPADKARLLQILDWINAKYSSGDPSDIVSPPITDLPYYNDQIQFSLGPQGQERIFFYKGDDLFNSLDPDNQLPNAVKAIDPSRMNQLNVYLTGAYYYGAYWATMPTFSLGWDMYVMMPGQDNPLESGDWVRAGGLAHELGHTLGLYHTYNSGGAEAQCSNTDEYLSDVFGLPQPGTCPHPSGWSPDCRFSNNDLHTNDLMASNACTEYESPMQVGQMHRSLALKTTRRYVSEEVFDPNYPVTLNSNFPIPLTSNWVFDFDIKLYTDLIVPENVTLTVKCKIVMPYKGKIIVQQGGKLVVDGGTITTDSKNHLWKGIEVWGHSNQHQYTINGHCAQGIVQLINGGTIENADTAINVWKPGDYTTTGGVVLANSSNFINNKCGVNFVTYHNFHPITHTQTNNLSYFHLCNFTTNTSYYGSDVFYAFIKMLEVEGIRVEGCSLLNSTPLSSSPTPPTRGAGIRTLNAAFIVNSVCNSPYQPCPPSSILHTIFQGLSFGIVSASSGPSKSVRVFDSHFIDNDRGVYLSDVNNSTIVNNNFYIGTDNICPNQTGIGVELVNSFGYSVEDNYFTHSNTLPTGNWYIGICVKHPRLSEVTFNEIYRNTFDGLNVGNQAEGCNFNIIDYVGLSYFCNNNSSNTYDFYVNGDGIYLYQGSLTEPAGNTFTHIYNANIPGSDFDNESTFWPVIYYYNSLNSGERPIYINSPAKVILQPTDHQNTCPSNYNGSGNQTMLLTQQQIDSLTQEFAYNSIASDNILAIYENLKDGGSTSATNLDITSAVPAQTMQLREELLGKSPHLSEDVLKNAIDKFDVLPDAILLDILSANPDEMRNEELMNYLKSRTPAFPDYMVDLLSALALDTTYKTTLLQTLSSYNVKKTRAAYKILRNSVNDSVVDMTFFRNWLDNLHNINADYQIIDSWLQEGNSSSALSLLDMIPSIYNLGDSSLIEYTYFKDLKTIQANLIASGNDILQMNTDQIRTLENIASMSKGIAGTQASNILEFGYGYFYPQCPSMVNQNIISKSVKHNIPDLLNSIYEPKIKAFPNPANNWTAFYYELPDGRNNGSIEIADANGHNVKTFIVTNQKGQIIWDTREIISGIYLYICKCDKYLKTGKLTINH